MEHAKKLILVEPRLFEQMQLNKEYKEIQKPADRKRKSTLSMEMRNVLQDAMLGDDIKAKQYQQIFRRFKATGSKVLDEDEGGFNALTDIPVVRKKKTTKKASPKKRRNKRLSWVQL